MVLCRGCLSGAVWCLWGMQDLLKHKLIFIETQDVVETTLALDNFRRACDCGRGAIFFRWGAGERPHATAGPATLPWPVLPANPFPLWSAPMLQGLEAEACSLIRTCIYYAISFFFG